MVPMVVMMLAGLGLLGYGIRAAMADHARQQRFVTAATCPAGASAAGDRDTGCAALSTRQVAYVATVKDTTSISFHGDTQMMHFDRAPLWILHLTNGDSVRVLSWHGEDEALCGPGAARDTVYAQNSPIVTEDDHAAAALLGVMFACYGGAIALGCVRRGFRFGARIYRRFMRLYDFAVVELTIVAFAAMISAILVGSGKATSGILLPVIVIPIASVIAAFVLRARFRRDLLRLQAFANQPSPSGGE